MNLIENLKQNWQLCLVGAIALGLVGFTGGLILENIRPREIVGLETSESENLTPQTLCEWEGKRLIIEGLVGFEKEVTTIIPVDTGDTKTNIVTHSTNFNYYPNPKSTETIIQAIMTGLHQKDYPTDAFKAKLEGNVQRYLLYNTESCYLNSASITPLTGTKK